jgi:CBS domain-containing protein
MLKDSEIPIQVQQRLATPHGFITGRDIRDRLREGFGSEVVALRHRLTFLAIAIVLCAIFAITYAHANLPMTPLPAFIPAYITAVVMTELITAYLLFVHTPLSRRFDLLWLAGAYLFSSAMAGGELAVLPGSAPVRKAPSGSGCFGMAAFRPWSWRPWP